jgi:hypothetical protein
MRQKKIYISLFAICILYLLCVPPDTAAEDEILSGIRKLVAIIWSNKVYLGLWIPFVVVFGYLVHLISRHLKIVATLSMFSQYHTQETIPNEKSLYAAFCETPRGSVFNPSNLPTDTTQYMTRTLRVFERLGLLVRHGGVNKDAMLYLIGDVCVRLWIMLEQHIKTERTRRGDRFWHVAIEYLTMLSLQFHIKNSRGDITIYHPDEPNNKDKGKTYDMKELTKKLQEIKAEMKVMKKAF